MLTWCILKGALITYLVTLKLMKVTNPQHRMYNSNIYQIFISFSTRSQWLIMAETWGC